MNVSTRPRYRVVTSIYQPFVMYNDSSGTFYGYCIDLLNAIAEISGFDYDIRESKDFGHLTRSGEWTGMVKDLITDAADISAAPLWITHSRRQVVDYTEPFYKENGIAIMMRKPKQATFFLWFLTILDYHVWLNFAAGFLLTSILIYLFERCLLISYKNAPEKYRGQPNSRYAKLRECFWFCLMSFTSESCGELPKNLAGKLAAVVWWLFVFVIVAVYNANLTVYRTLYRLERHIETIDDLRRQNQVEYSTVYNSSAHRYFKNLRDSEKILSNLWKQLNLDDSMSDYEKSKLSVWEYPVEEKYTKIYEAMKKTGFFANIQEAVDSVRKVNRTREFAYVGEAMLIRYLVLTNCDLKQVGREFGEMPFAFAVKKGSPLKSKLDDAIAQAMVQGISSKLENKWWDENPAKAHCSNSNEIDSGFTFRDMAAIFLLIPIGIFLTSVILCLQYYRFHRTK
ncbi:hypothetical protein X777_06826 [Ooceraea biroi]|uniref:Glutamate receptor n=1 Tax=Ooceraea biroi TaxID=2015173 RepID=A0A026WFC4_OOCBI|nr:hypothetical protein X777_06826 [Ooceraea biroi]